MSKKTQTTQDLLAATMEAAAAEPSFLPRLDFGDKSAVGYNIVTVLSEPREIEYESRFSGQTERAFVVDARLEETSFIDGESQPGGEYGLFLPIQEKGLHGLTKGVLALAKENGGVLSGLRLRISTRTYEHKQYGTTRGYTVTKAADDAE